MSYGNLLADLQKPDASRELALQVLQESRDPCRALELFQVASALRDQTLGRDLWWSGGISGVLPCLLQPRCRYCASYREDIFPLEDILAGVRGIEQFGVQHMHLSGGTRLEGYDSELLAMVQAVQAVSKIELEVNLGPSLPRECVRQLKALGVRSVTSSLETCDPALFAEVKPGESLDGRKRLLEICEEEGMPIRSMVLIGLGETEQQRIEHLFYMKHFKKLYQLRFSRFQPIAEGTLQQHPRCSPWEVARIIAVARLLMPQVDLALALGNTVDDIPLWFMAGGGNQIGAGHVSRKIPGAKAHAGVETVAVNERVTVVSRMEQQTRYVAGLGRKITFDYPPRYRQA